MRIFMMSVLLLMVANSVFAQRTVPTKATFVVRDEMGQPVKNAEIEGGFRDVTNAGSRDRFKGVTDTNGILVVEGNAMIGVGGRITAEGYYETITSVPLDMNRGKNIDRWEVEIPVLLKRIRNPIPMYVKELRNPYVSCGDLSRTSRYDIVKGAFLPPYGNGEVGDLEFKWSMTVYVTNKLGRAMDYDTLCEIRMTNIVDGVCKGVPDGGKGDSKKEGSAYISAYEAPMGGYTNAISFYRNVRGRKAESNDEKWYLYYFRIRTQTNELGQVTNALYGTIHGQINGNFGYFLNPTPNDRNMEFDPKKNLFKDLKSTEEVTAP